MILGDQYEPSCRYRFVACRRIHSRLDAGPFVFRVGDGRRCPSHRDQNRVHQRARLDRLRDGNEVLRVVFG